MTCFHRTVGRFGQHFVDANRDITETRCDIHTEITNPIHKTCYESDDDGNPNQIVLADPCEEVIASDCSDQRENYYVPGNEFEKGMRIADVSSEQDKIEIAFVETQLNLIQLVGSILAQPY